MAYNNGAIAPNDGGTPDAALPDDAIDGAIQAVEAVEVDTRAIKAEQEVAELKQRQRAQEDVIGELRRSNTQYGEMISELVGRSREQEDRGLAWAREDILTRMQNATRNADENAFLAARHDLDAYEQHTRKQKAPKKDDPPAASEKQPGQADAATQAAQRAWIADNPWFNTDNKLRAAAIAVDGALLAEKPHLTVAERLKEVREAVVRIEPDKFTNQARQQPPTVSRPGPQSGAKPKPKAKGLADLPEDAKLALARIKRRDPSFTDDDYIKSYKWDQ